MQIHIDEHVKNGCAVLDVAGEIDVYTAPTLRERLNDAANNTTCVIVDLNDVGFMDSTGLGVLIGGLKRLRQNDGELYVVCTSEPVLKIFKITGLTEVLGVVASYDALPDNEMKS